MISMRMTDDGESIPAEDYFTAPHSTTTIIMISVFTRPGTCGTVVLAK